VPKPIRYLAGGLVDILRKQPSVFLRESDLRAVSQIWGELAEFPVSQTDEALTHALRELARTVGASNAFWVGAHRAEESSPIGDPRSWSILATAELVSSERRTASVARESRRFAAGDVDPTTYALVSLAGTSRALLRRELVDDDTWRQSWLYNEVLQPLGIGDPLTGAHTIDAYNESYIGVERDLQAKPFGERERDVLRLFLSGANALHRALVRAESTSRRLTPRERQVLSLLLAGLSERDISRRLAIGQRTTHQHVVAILHKYGLSGRIGLMAHFLQHR
jgi:DNA-binding CsgD family transcriptional regulator